MNVHEVATRLGLDSGVVDRWARRKEEGGQEVFGQGFSSGADISEEDFDTFRSQQFPKLIKAGSIFIREVKPNEWKLNKLISVSVHGLADSKWSPVGDVRPYGDFDIAAKSAFDNFPGAEVWRWPSNGGAARISPTVP